MELLSSQQNLVADKQIEITLNTIENIVSVRWKLLLFKDFVGWLLITTKKKEWSFYCISDSIMRLTRA